MADYKIDLRQANNWEALPNPWKVVKKVSKVDIKYSLTDPKFIGIFEPFFSDDAIRPQMNGLFISGESLVASDAHMLIQLINRGGLEDGLYLISPKIAKKTKNKLGKINAKFPDWEVIIKDDNEIVFNIDLRKLKTYCEAVIKGKYCNEVTKQITFLVQKGVPNKKVSFNADYLLEVLETFMKLGYNSIYGGYESASRAVYFAPEKDIAKNPKSAIRKSDFALLMPLMAHNQDEDFFGSQDLDLKTGISCYYSFEDNEIHNSDGSIAYFDYNQTSKELPYISELHFDMLKRIAGNNSRMPILDNVHIKAGKAVAHDFNQLISILNVRVEDGVYEIVSGAFKNSMYELDDFPQAIDTKQYNYLGAVDNFELSEYLKEAKDFVGDDDLRPVFKGIGYVYNGNNLNIFSTNSYILYKHEITSSYIKDINNVLLNPKNQAYILQNMDADGLCDVSVSDEKEYFSFTKGTIRYITKSVDVKPPNYQSVIYSSTDRVLAIDKKAILDVISGLKGEDAKDNITFKFENDIPQQGDVSGTFKLYTSVQESGAITIKKDLKVNIAYELFSFDREWEEENTSLIMPIVNDDNTVIQFNPKLLSTFLSVNQTSENIFFKSDRKNGQFLVKLNSLSSTSVEPIYRKLTQPIISATPQPKVQSKEDIEKIIKGLEVLVKLGNVSAEQKIKGYKIILKLK